MFLHVPVGIDTHSYGERGKGEKKERGRKDGRNERRKEGRKGGRQNIQTETKQITDFCTHAFVKGLIFKG